MQHQSNVSLNNVLTTIMKTYTSWRISRVSSNLFKSFCVAFLFTYENIVRQTIVAEVIRDKYHVIIINNLSLDFISEKHRSTSLSRAIFVYGNCDALNFSRVAETRASDRQETTIEKEGSSTRKRRYCSIAFRD